MHLSHRNLGLGQGATYLLYLGLLSAEDYHALQFILLEQPFDNRYLLGLVTQVSALLDFLSRFAYGEFYDYRVFQKSLCQVLYLLRHGGREHNYLAVLWQQLGYGQDIFRKAHIQHSVGFIKDEE